MDDKNPITDANNFHSAPDMGRSDDEPTSEEVVTEEITEEVVEPADGGDTPKVNTIAVEEVSFAEETKLSSVPAEEKPAEAAASTEPVIESMVEVEEAEAEPEVKTETAAEPAEKKPMTMQEMLAEDGSYSEEDRVKRNMEQLSAAPQKKKTNLVSTIIIVLAVVLLTAVVVFAVLMLTQKDKNNNVVENTTPTEPDVAYTTLTCTKKGSVDDRVAVGNATSIDMSIVASYADDDMEDISDTTEYTWTDAAAAKTGATQVKDAYDKKIESLGLIAVQEDPFTTSYALDGSKLVATHFAEYDDLDKDNAVIFGLPTDDNGVVTDSDAVRQALKTKGYTCKVKQSD